jgi:hypothetical protein
MTTLKTATLVAALIAGATSLAFAQNAPMARGGYGDNGMPPKGYNGSGAIPTYPSSPEANAAASGGGGTHVSSQKTGSAENTQKVIRNQNGYRGLYAYQPSQRCLILRREGRALPRSCR